MKILLDMNLSPAWVAFLDHDDQWLPEKIERQMRLLEANPEWSKAQKSCSDCHGTGKRMTTYNPKSKWDWWVVGGRWNGAVKGEPRGDEKGFNFGEEFHPSVPAGSRATHRPQPRPRIGARSQRRICVARVVPGRAPLDPSTGECLNAGRADSEVL